MYIFFRIIIYSFILICLAFLFCIIYYIAENTYSFFDAIELSFLVLLNMPLDTISHVHLSQITFIIVIQKFIDNIVLALLAAFIFSDIINKPPPTILPPKLLLRRRTSPGVEDKIAIAFVVGNKYGNKRKIYDATANLTYIYKNKDDSINANTQLSYNVQMIKNYNTFYFYIEEFPSHFIENILSKSNSDFGFIDIVIHGKVEPYLHNFAHEIQYNTSDIIIAKAASPDINYKYVNIDNLYFFIKKIYNQLNKVKNKFTFRNKQIDLSRYTECTNDEKRKITEELTSMLLNNNNDR